ncbi:acyl-CoA thioesterase [uncultured Jatrophihabitans sp.]|uniref:acyl-CoA thioesterase n=1 Tax=uncultured Jatrophihabitans sp. TaxID=1610747 RepID=UPI0035CA4EC5
MAEAPDPPDAPALAGQAAVDGLVDLLDLERIEVDIYRGGSPQVRSQRVFGGQVAGQALVAAGRSVEPDRLVHSLHSYFIRAGDPTMPIVYEVDRVRDGRSFSVRRVTAVQRGKAIFTLSASFQLAQDGLDHQSDMPAAPEPTTLPTFTERYRADPRAEHYWRDRPRPIDVRYVDAAPWERDGVGPNDGVSRVWMRADGKLPDDPLLHVCVLTFASDMTLLDAALARQGLANQGTVMMASLDHAMWFERTFRADEWLLYTMKSPSASGGRALATGRFHRQDGTLVCSVVQEGLIRVRG